MYITAINFVIKKLYKYETTMTSHIFITNCVYLTHIITVYTLGLYTYRGLANSHLAS